MPRNEGRLDIWVLRAPAALHKYRLLAPTPRRGAGKVTPVIDRT